VPYRLESDVVWESNERLDIDVKSTCSVLLIDPKIKISRVDVYLLAKKCRTSSIICINCGPVRASEERKGHDRLVFRSLFKLQNCHTFFFW
jgi:hypothetical protein